MRDTLIVVHCYRGDRGRVFDFLPHWLHHGQQVLVLSPTDAPVLVEEPGVICRQAGLAGWKGPQTVERQIEHWKIAAEFPQPFVLMHDSDSVCLSPELPAYLYEEPDTFWCNEIGDHFLNYEPPYFFSRENLLRLIDATEKDPTPEARERARGATGGIPFEGDWSACNAIDGFYVASTESIGLAHRSFPDGVHAYPANMWLVEQIRNEGTRLIHGVKTIGVLEGLAAAYEIWASKASDRAPEVVG